MKRFGPVLLCLLLALSLTVTALAASVPDSFVAENLNGLQQIVKTYTLAPDVDPETLVEPPFDYDGFHYTWGYTTKQENAFAETKTIVDRVVVETSKKDLSVILAALAPTISYDDGTFAGTLALDHTTIVTKASGYTTKYATVTATQTIGPVPRNDMSYVPATMLKDGRTLTLSNVEWQVTGTALMGDALVPAAYQAVATYSGQSSYQSATGYISTVEYTGEVTRSGIESVTYTVVYVGEAITPPEPEPAPEDPSTSDGTEDPGETENPNETESPGETEAPDETEDPDATRGPGMAVNPAEQEPGGAENPSSTGGEEPKGPDAFKMVIGVLGAVIIVCTILMAVLLFLRRKNVYVYIPGSSPRDYKLVGRYRAEETRPRVDIRELEPYPEGVVAVEIKRSLAKKLVGQTFTVRHRNGEYAYIVTQDKPCDWHTFELEEAYPV